MDMFRAVTTLPISCRTAITTSAHSVEDARERAFDAHTTQAEQGRQDGDVYALFDAAIRQQLQGEARACPARPAVSAGRDRHPQGREPYARVPGEESERPGAAARGGAGALCRGVECDPVAPRQPLGPASRGPLRPRRGAAMDVLRAALDRAQYRRGVFLADASEGRTRAAAARAR